MAERKSNRMHVLKLIGTVCAMFVFGFALVPLLSLIHI